MELTNKDLARFQKLYRDNFGIELDDETAYRKLSHLVRQMELVYQPITAEQRKAIKDVDGDYHAKPKTPSRA